MGYSAFTQEAFALIVYPGGGLLRRPHNLWLGALIEAVRDQTCVVELKRDNRVLI
jgi:hypothetical protein